MNSTLNDQHRLLEQFKQFHTFFTSLSTFLLSMYFLDLKAHYIVLKSHAHSNSSNPSSYDEQNSTLMHVIPLIMHF
jgi:hypothetical protein